MKGRLSILAFHSFYTPLFRTCTNFERAQLALQMTSQVVLQERAPGSSATSGPCTRHSIAGIYEDSE